MWISVNSHITAMTFVPYRSCATSSHIPIELPGRSALCSTDTSTVIFIDKQNQKCYRKLEVFCWLKMFILISYQLSLFSFSFSWEIKAFEWPTQCPPRNVWNLFSLSDHCRAAWGLGNCGSTPIHPALSLDNLEIQLLLLNMSLRPVWNAKGSYPIPAPVPILGTWTIYDC